MVNIDEETENTCKIEKIKTVYSEGELKQQVDIFKAIADPTRLNILYILEGRELCSCIIQNSLNKAQPTISHHINILKKANLIKGRKKGTWIYYSLTDPEIIKFLKKIK